VNLMDDERVEKMIAAGRAIVDAAIAEYKPVAIVAAYSSGDDSIVSTHFGMTTYGAHGCRVFNADTMVGLRPSREHLKAVCERYGWPLEIGQAIAEGPPSQMLIPRDDGSRKQMKVLFDPAKLPAGRWLDGETAYEEMVLNYGFPGPGMHPIAYRRLKERPIGRMLRQLGCGAGVGKPRVLIVSGIRHDESSRRAGYRCATAEGNFGDVWANPFYWQTAADFEAYRQEFGLPRNPVKRACGISGECCCGAFGDSIAERVAYRKVDPAFADYLDQLEQRVKANGFPWGWAERPPRWWMRLKQDQKTGQKSLFDDLEESTFQPMCVGCNNGRR